MIDFKAKREAAAVRKLKRQDKAKTLWPKKSKRKLPPLRKREFSRLKANCIMFVLLRAKHRTGGFCEVGIVCHGVGPIELWYHITPQAMGNALKYDHRNILGSCRQCNGGEYFARKRGSQQYIERHKAIIGPDAYAYLLANQGRKQISTNEATRLADQYEYWIESGLWRSRETVYPENLPPSRANPALPELPAP